MHRELTVWTDETFLLAPSNSARILIFKIFPLLFGITLTVLFLS